MPGQRQELDLAQRRLRTARHRDDAGEARDGREQIRDRQGERLRVALENKLEAGEALQLIALRRRQLDQRVDEETIALDRRHTTGRRVRRADEAELFEI